MADQVYRFRPIEAVAAPAIVGPARSEGKSRSKAPLWAHVSMAVFMLAALLLGGALFEAQTSSLQATYFSGRAAQLSFELAPGPSPAALPAPKGPYDQRLGYADLDEIVKRLSGQGFEIEAQARSSAKLRELVDAGLFPIYRPKARGGLQILDRRGEVLVEARYPERVFETFEGIPEVLVETLLFIENRQLLDVQQAPRANPALDFRRLARAIFDQALSTLGSERDVPGGSTLATQMEKFRHSPAGRTNSVEEKWRQILSASYRVYLDGPETGEASRRVVMDYLNSVPLGARPGWGEVHGIGDGLWVWFGADLDGIVKNLEGNPERSDGELFVAYGRAYRMVLSLILAQQRPTVFLPRRIDGLNERSAMFLRVLEREGVISEDLRDEALRWPVELGPRVSPHERNSRAESKAVAGLMGRLTTLLGRSGAHELLRTDVAVNTTLDLEAQSRALDRLEGLRDRTLIRELGLQGRPRMGQGDPEEVIYGFVLYERGQDRHRLRVNVDTHEGAMDLNEGSKLDLGSTAKLRTLAHYLEIIEALHKELSAKSPQDLALIKVGADDRLTRWAIEYLSEHEGVGLDEMLKASMHRRYSANPYETFWTGGGEHRFGNVTGRHDQQVLTVWQSFAESANLPFVRMMRDIVYYHIERLPDDLARAMEDEDDPRRDELLARFAQREGRKLVRQFYAAFQGLDEQVLLDEVTRGQRRTLSNLATIYRHVRPDGDIQGLGNYLEGQGRSVSATRLVELYERYKLGSVNVNERRGEDALNPLELWVARYVLEHPESTPAEVLEASGEVRGEARQWLLWADSARKTKQHIYTALEERAFEEILIAWQGLGYPFGYLVPSYATALGSSADRPASLAELMGIVLSDGKRLPLVRFEGLTFAKETPFEVRLARGVDDEAVEGEHVLSTEVAGVLKSALDRVVTQGTGRPLREGMMTPGGEQLPIAGKTGTADHRFHDYDRRGRIVGSRAVNRTATWTFSIGECYFGTLVAYVPGEEADAHTFMSALVVGLLKELDFALEPVLEDPRACIGAAADGVHSGTLP